MADILLMGFAPSGEAMVSGAVLGEKVILPMIAVPC